MRNPARLTRRELLSPAHARSPDELVHIASLLVQATDRGCAGVRHWLEGMSRVEIHDTGHPGKLAVVLESADDRVIGGIAAQLQNIAGVISVSIVAHVVESEAELRKEHDGE